MKTFCVLEQGNKISEDLTLKKKKIFSTKFSDFFRLNWSGLNDPEAFISQKNITFSEGRSLLYEKVPKNYDYYIFCDDDVEFEYSDNNKIAERIHDLLTIYKPIAATFFDPNSWAFSWYKKYEINKIYKRECFPIAGFDLQVHIFQKNFADLMFPVVYHGSGRSMSYAQWFCNRLAPSKQICFSSIQVSNTRHELHLDKKLDDFVKSDEIIWLFNRHVRNNNKGIPFDKKEVVEENYRLFKSKNSINHFSFTRENLNEIYDLNNSFYKNRVAKIDFNYRKRMRVLNLLWNFSLINLKFKIGNIKSKLIRYVSDIIKI